MCGEGRGGSARQQEEWLLGGPLFVEQRRDSTVGSGSSGDTPARQVGAAPVVGFLAHDLRERHLAADRFLPTMRDVVAGAPAFELTAEDTLGEVEPAGGYGRPNSSATPLRSSVIVDCCEDVLPKVSSRKLSASQ